ncbi:MAG: hypothetical protein GF405_00390 [Candidatus Eisenbacteria bacterium]|nr:hypothetical protein [Candidatus Eisenbacteria bacterium]
MPLGGWDDAVGRPSAGVDWRQLRALLVASILLDVRSSRSRYGGSKVPPLVIVLITYTVMGVLLAVALIRSGDPFAYTIFTLSGAMFMTALTVIMEYGTVVVNPDDYEIMAHRPISSRTYFWAKVANLLFYASLMATTLAGPGAILGGFTFPSGAAFGLTHYAMALLSCWSTAALVVVLYSAAVRVVRYDRFTSAITYVHTAATLVLTMGYVFLPRMLADDPTLISIARGGWLFAAPPAWYAAVVDLASGGAPAQSALLAALAGISSALVLGLALPTISLGYAGRLAELASTAPGEVQTPERRQGASRFPLGRLVCSGDGERAGYELMASYLARERKLRSRVYPAFGLPLAAYLFGLITGALHDPLLPSPDGAGLNVMNILGLYCVFISFFFASAMTQTDQWKASWLFYAAPVADRSELVVGARKVVIWRYLVPFFSGLFVLLSFAMPLVSAAAFVIVTCVLSLVTFSLIGFTAPHLPLSQSVEKARQMRQLGIVALLAMAMGIVIGIQKAFRTIPMAGAFVLVGLVVAAWVLELVLRRRLRRRLAEEEFLG